MIRECAEWDSADLYQMGMFFPRGFCSDFSSSDGWFKRNLRNGQAPNPWPLTEICMEFLRIPVCWFVQGFTHAAWGYKNTWHCCHMGRGKEIPQTWYRRRYQCTKRCVRHHNPLWESFTCLIPGRGLGHLVLSPLLVYLLTIIVTLFITSTV